MSENPYVEHENELSILVRLKTMNETINLNNKKKNVILFVASICWLRI